MVFNDQGHKTQQSVLTMQYAVFFSKDTTFLVCWRQSCGVCRLSKNFNIWIWKQFKESKGGPLLWLIDKARTFVQFYVKMGRQNFFALTQQWKVWIWLNVLKSVNFKKKVWILKLCYFLFWFVLKEPQFWKKRDSRNCLLKMNGLYYFLLFFCFVLLLTITNIGLLKAVALNFVVLYSRTIVRQRCDWKNAAIDKRF